jgi:hypothetical protein
MARMWLWHVEEMFQPKNPSRGFRLPPEIIAHAIWLYH